jgi:general stress protein YciG
LGGIEIITENNVKKDKAVNEAAKLLGQRGGLRTAATHDKAYFQEIGKRGIESRERNRAMIKDMAARVEKIKTRNNAKN